MKHSEILKRAWKILWDYKALWIFGIILVLTTASNTGNQFNWRTNNQREDGREMQFNPNEDFWPQMGEEMKKGLEEARQELERMLASENSDKLERNFVIALITLMGVILVLSIIGTVLRYVARTALIKMVDRYEETAEKLKVREGWGLGWSNDAWRIFVVDLLIFLPAFVIGAAAFSLAIVPIITITSGMPAMGVLGLVASIGLILLLSLIGLIFAAFVSLVRPVVYRKVVLEELGAIEGIKDGWKMFRSAWKQYGLMWLILKGIDLVWPLVMLPFALLSGGIALLMGGGFTFLAGGRAIESGDPSMVWPIVIGIVIVILVLMIPLAFLGGLRETFQSTSWTLAYRELKAEGLLANGNGGTLLLPEDKPQE
ncbi:MAG: hypothetical protein JW757_12955 [Anaerolineales bacterium]|nr:hypothetical protein [Anaerolineales bacterium]